MYEKFLYLVISGAMFLALRLLAYALFHDERRSGVYWFKPKTGGRIFR